MAKKKENVEPESKKPDFRSVAVAVASLIIRQNKLEQRIDRLVDAIVNSKKIKGI